ncbi:MAG: PAS domain S-box protein [Desulfobulbaceae bacterium]|nr:PAS domain S-box protein [Desulfobulbaceae bacterium]
MILIISITYLNHKNFEKTVVSQMQTQLLIIAKTTTDRVEDYIAKHSATLKVLAINPLVREEIHKRIMHKNPGPGYCLLKTCYETYMDESTALTTLDENGIMLHRHPFITDRPGRDHTDKPGVAYVIQEHKSHVSEVFYNNSGALAISISKPVFYKGEFTGIIRWMIQMDTIHKRFIQPINESPKGYAWIFDDKGVVLSHPEKEFVQISVLDMVKKRHLEKSEAFNENSLREHIREQHDYLNRVKTEDEGSGIFIDCTTGKNTVMAYKRIAVGDRDWHLIIALPYSEIADPVSRHARNTFGLTGLVIMLFSAGGTAFYKTQKKKTEFETEAKYLKEITTGAKALQKSEEKLAGIIASVTDHMSMMDKEYNIVWANHVAKDLFGTDIIGKKCYNAYHGYDKACEPCVVKKCFEDEKVHEHETEVIGIDGNPMTFWCTASPAARHRDGRLKMVIEISRDITKRKRAEKALKHTTEQLSVLLKSLPIIPYTCKAEDNFGITYISTTIEEITGYTPSQFTEDPTFWADRIHMADRSNVLEALSALLRHGKYNQEYRFRIADGSYKWFADTRRLVKLPDGTISHIVGTWQDITEAKKLRQESEYRLQQIIQADKLASLGEVVAGVAHEINNPNSFICYNIPLMEETWQIFKPILNDYAATHPEWRKNSLSFDDLCRDMGEMIEAIKTGSKRISGVVNNLKDFSRTDENSQFKPVRINDVINKTLTIVGAQVRKSVIHIDINLADNLPEIQGHFQKLEQVVANLVVNAIHAIPNKDKGRLSITTRYLDRFRSILIEIEDNGTGLEPETMNRMFDPFFTTRRESGGTGLGLSVSYGLVREHNGTIGVLSHPGRGSRFTVFLPVHKGIKLNLRPSILCVDDDMDFLAMLETLFFLETRDKFLATINNPKDVLEYLTEHPEVDIVLSDIRMPGMNGWELIKKIKARFPLLTVILFSGDPKALKEKPADTVGPDYLLQKPFKIKGLQQIINKISRQKL